jgi:hypothetical protein
MKQETQSDSALRVRVARAEEQAWFDQQLAEHHYLGAALRVLPRQWVDRFGYRAVLAESFTDPEVYAGTCYKVSKGSFLACPTWHGMRMWRRSVIGKKTGVSTFDTRLLFLQSGALRAKRPGMACLDPRPLGRRGNPQPLAT